MSSESFTESESETASPPKKSSPEPELLYVSESDDDTRFFRVSFLLSQFTSWRFVIFREF